MQQFSCNMVQVSNLPAFQLLVHKTTFSSNFRRMRKMNCPSLTPGANVWHEGWLIGVLGPSWAMAQAAFGFETSPGPREHSLSPFLFWTFFSHRKGKKTLNLRKKLKRNALCAFLFQERKLETYGGWYKKQRGRNTEVLVLTSFLY